jgi:hypothetical protein
MIIGTVTALIGYLSGSGFTKMSLKKPGGKLAIQFIGVVIVPLAAAWALSGGEFQGQRFGICLGAAVMGHLTSLNPGKK